LPAIRTNPGDTVDKLSRIVRLFNALFVIGILMRDDDVDGA